MLTFRPRTGVQAHAVWSLIATSIALAGLGGWAVTTSPNLLLLFVAIIAGASYLSLSLSSKAILALILTTATYRGAFFAVRTTSAGMDIGAFDLLWLVLFAHLIIGLLAGRYRRIDRSTIPFVFSICATVAVGIYFNQPLHNILKLFRTELFLVTGVIASQVLPLSKQVTFLRTIAIGGALTGLSQVVTFAFASQGIQIWALLGVAAKESPTFFDVDTSATSIFRDNGVTINFAVVSSIIVLTSLITRRGLFGRTTTALLLALSVVGVVLSLTRGAWLGLLVGGIIAVIQTRHMSVGRLLNWIGIGLLVGIVVFVWTAIDPNSDLIEQVLRTRLGSLEGGFEDTTVSARLLEIRETLDTLGANWLFGVGAATVSYVSEGTFGQAKVVVRNQLHNGYLQYLLGGGLLALLSLLWMIARSLAAGWLAARKSDSDTEHFIAVSGLASVAAMLFISLTGGVINDSFQAPVLGALIGMMLSLSGRSKTAWGVHTTRPTTGGQLWR